MDLLGTGQQQGGGHQPPGTAMNCAEKPGTGPDSSMMSRPSLISSLWSIQVQNEGSASDYPMAGCGSQQSLPEMLSQAGVTAYHHCNGFSGGTGMVPGGSDQIQLDLAGAPMDVQMPATMATNLAGGTSLRPVKSLSDLHTLTAAQIAQTAAVMPCPSHQQQATGGPSDQSYLGFRRQTETGNYYNMLSRQQRDSQICEWLQKLNVGGGGTETSGSESPSQEFYHHHQQQRPPFQRADTTDQ